jgi:AbrB family looped-hinge helix DNA binding protein
MKAKIVKVSDKGQIAIPKEIRTSLEINKGDELLLIAEGDVIIIEKIKKENFKDLLKLSEKTAKKIWDNDEDEIWNEL